MTPNSFLPAVWFSICAAGCAASTIPDPKEAVNAYAEAAAKGDSDAIYEMLSEKSKRGLSPDEVKKLVADERAELSDQAKAVTAPGVIIKARAKVRYGDGEDASLDLEGDEFRIAAADALPAGARTPQQALSQLRRVLARRSYAGLMQVLTPATRSAIEADLRSLVKGLEEPEALNIDQTGDSATVQIPGGHKVKLKREGGVWRVDDFD
ncbi:MAG: hypothetical protein IPK82_27230 [Polyangiaceae bacterium]|nr:hypothetical protein [Polyangiaceae bacterium]